MKTTMLFTLFALCASANAALASTGKVVEVTGTFHVQYRHKCTGGQERAEANAVQLALLQCVSNVQQVTPFIDGDRGNEDKCQDFSGGTYNRAAKFECLPITPEHREKLISNSYTVDYNDFAPFQSSEPRSQEPVTRFLNGVLGTPQTLENVFSMPKLSEDTVKAACQGPFVRIRPYVSTAKPVDGAPGKFEITTNASYLCNEQPHLL